MKCQHCGKHEATFYYQSTVNGRTAQAHLCAACAEELQRSYDFELRYVPCMRLCGKGPNLRWDGKLYHRAEEALLRELVSADAKPK